uniref:Uncharacterized protein n=1 Tax=Nelumbo nucifera TaxID=4432 RepID=A0A822ZW70_NELNU|nr:TPA_asm: hypothetical protein HUJ06_017717 [Nelumbo nucifera]
MSTTMMPNLQARVASSIGNQKRSAHFYSMELGLFYFYFS